MYRYEHTIQTYEDADTEEGTFTVAINEETLPAQISLPGTSLCANTDFPQGLGAP